MHVAFSLQMHGTELFEVFEANTEQSGPKSF